MKAIFDRKHLLEGLKTAARATAARAHRPGARHIALHADEASGEFVRIVGANEVFAIEEEVDARVIAPGEVALPVPTIIDAVAAMSGDSIMVETPATPCQVRLSCPPADITLNCVPPDECLPPPAADGGLMFDVEGARLYDALRRVLFAVSTDELRTALTGVLFESEGEKLTLVATDTYRLSVCDVPLPSPPGDIRAIVPGKAAAELSRLAAEAISVSCTISEKHASFSGPCGAVKTVLVDALYPVYRRVIPTTALSTISVPAESFTAAVRRAGIIAARDNARVKLEVDAGRMIVSSESGNLGRHSEIVDVELSGEPVTLAFNHRYLLDAVNGVNADTVVIRTEGPQNPAVFRPHGRDDYLCVVMPMSLEQGTGG